MIKNFDESCTSELEIREHVFSTIQHVLNEMYPMVRENGISLTKMDGARELIDNATLESISTELTLEATNQDSWLYEQPLPGEHVFVREGGHRYEAMYIVDEDHDVRRVVALRKGADYSIDWELVIDFSSEGLRVSVQQPLPPDDGEYNGIYPYNGSVGFLPMH